MKRIINGRKYDTDTATEVFSDGFSHESDSKHWSEILYKKKNGEFFLHGKGGPLSKYREAGADNSWFGGQKIIPLTIEEAKEWFAEHADSNSAVELYEETFGLVEE